jgi:predicted RNA-binding Zn ribbon-like protein
LKNATADTIRLVGGTLCLDFVNTVIWDGPGKPRPQSPDVLDSPEAIAAWGTRLAVLAPGVEPAAADQHDRACELRSTVHEAFAAIAAGASPRPEALESLHGIYVEAVDRAWLAERAGVWTLTWPSDDAGSVRLAVAADALDLLSDAPRLARVRQCPGRDCGALFVDRTGRRRWCSMEACGSREKMRRLYERQRASASGH